jgi:hypothetical protein
MEINPSIEDEAPEVRTASEYQDDFDQSAAVVDNGMIGESVNIANTGSALGSKNPPTSAEAQMELQNEDSKINMFDASAEPLIGEQ